MKRNVVVAIAVLVVAGAAAVWLLGGPGKVFGTGGGDGVPVAGGNAPEALDASAGMGAGTDATAAMGEKRAVLFGRPRIERKGVGSLSGRVVRFKDQTPVEGATVLLTGRGNADETVSLRGATDAHGILAFSSVPAGDAYDLRVECKAEPGTTVPGIEVVAGSPKDLGTLYVGATARLEGRVVDEKGRPLPRAEVHLYAGAGGILEMMTNMIDLFGSLDREPTSLAGTTAEADGRFHFDDLTPGTYALRARAAGHAQGLVAARMTAEGSAGGPVTITLEAGKSLAGTVVDADGRGIARARLAILMEDDSMGPAGFVLGRVFTETEAAGAFAVALPESARKVRAIVAAEGYPSAYSQELHAGDREVRIVMTRGTTLEVRVETKEGHRAVEGAKVMVAVAESADMNRPDSTGSILTAVTDATGTATLSLRPGKIEMMMVASPYGGGMMEVGSRGMAGSGLDADIPTVIEAGKPAHAVVRLSEALTLEGAVLDPDGRPIAGATLRAIGMMGMGGGVGSAVSDAEGKYRLSGISRDAMGILVRAPGWVQRDGDVVTARPGKGEPTEPGPGAVVHRDFKLYPAATVRGRVIDGAGAPIAGASVSWNGRSGMRGMMEAFGAGGPSISGPDGVYVLFDVDSGAEDEAGGNGTVSVTAEGWVSARSAEFAVPTGAAVKAPDVTLSRGSTVRGVVLDPSGRRAADARVEVAIHADDRVEGISMRDLMESARGRSVHTGADGAFEVTTLPKGTVTLTASDEGAAASRRTVKVESGGAAPASVEIRLRLAGTVSGRVLGVDGKPLASASVDLGDSLVGVEGDDGFVAPARAVTKPDGTFSFDGLPPGRVSLTASAEGHQRSTLEAAVGGLPVEFALAAKNPADARRLQELQTELMDVYKKMSDAKTDAERQALQRRMADLSQEMQKLQADTPQGAPDRVESVPSEPAPPPAKPVAEPPAMK